jgi:hypothetical protein
MIERAEFSGTTNAHTLAEFREARAFAHRTGARCVGRDPNTGEWRAFAPWRPSQVRQDYPSGRDRRLALAELSLMPTDLRRERLRMIELDLEMDRLRARRRAAVTR